MQSVKVSKAKKEPEFKLGKWNPQIKLVEVDKDLESRENHPDYSCCVRCNNKNVFRAAVTGNLALMDKVMRDAKKVSNLTAFWSSDLEKTPLEFILESNDTKMIELFLAPKVGKIPAHSNYENERRELYSRRAIE